MHLVIAVLAAFGAGEVCGMLVILRNPRPQPQRQDETRPKLRLVK